MKIEISNDGSLLRIRCADGHDCIVVTATGDANIHLHCKAVVCLCGRQVDIPTAEQLLKASLPIPAQKPPPERSN